MRISDWSSDVCSSDLARLAGTDQLLEWLGQRAVAAAASDIELRRDVESDGELRRGNSQLYSSGHQHLSVAPRPCCDSIPPDAGTGSGAEYSGPLIYPFLRFELSHAHRHGQKHSRTS